MHAYFAPLEGLLCELRPYYGEQPKIAITASCPLHSSCLQKRQPCVQQGTKRGVWRGLKGAGGTLDTEILQQQTFPLDEACAIVHVVPHKC